ncbi:unnamed protein product [Rotaria socialis]|nr:unnamed protein product [Rotaria socialis]
MLHTILLIIGTIFIANIKGQSTVKFSSSCTVPICGVSNGGTSGSCSGSAPCFNFQSANETLCAPQVQCSLFDLCISGTRCATNTSICILNSCCSQPICMPRALASACVASNASATVYPPTYVTTTPPPSGVAPDTALVPIRPLSASIRLCNNATWDPNFSIISGADGATGRNATMFSNPYDVFIDQNNMIYVADYGNYRIQKFNTSSAIGTTVASTSPFQPTVIYVDGAETIYSCENAYGVMLYGRVQKYTQGNIYGITLLGGAGKCGAALNQLCGCSGIYADRSGSLYISDSENNRVLLYNTTTGSIALLAGTNGISGSQPDQLSYPGGIYVDENQTLFVLDGLNG